jgi:hypothetical protein
MEFSLVLVYYEEKSVDVSEEIFASIFRVGELANEETIMTCCFIV